VLKQYHSFLGTAVQAVSDFQNTCYHTRVGQCDLGCLLPVIRLWILLSLSTTGTYDS